MTPTLARSIVVAVPVTLFLVMSIARLSRRRTASTAMQSAAALCFLVVVLAHVAEGAHLLRFMGWGEPHSVGHDVDLGSAIFGVVLLTASALAAVGVCRGRQC